MKKPSPLVVRVIMALALLGALTVLRHGPFRQAYRGAPVAGSDDNREKLVVGFLPVT